MQNQDIRLRQRYAYFEILRFILLGVNFGLWVGIQQNNDTVTENYTEKKLETMRKSVWKILMFSDTYMYNEWPLV